MNLAIHSDYKNYHEFRWRERENQERIKFSMAFKILKIVTLVIFSRHFFSKIQNSKKVANILYFKL